MDSAEKRGSRLRFDEIVMQYDKIRPAYPRELLEKISDFAGGNAAMQALEIGAGTGKATEYFLEKGCYVTAVEIGKGMGAYLRHHFKNYKDFRVIVDAFENVSLKDGEYDLIYAATAFHWVDANIGCPKAFRILKPGGVFALFRYNILPASGDECYEAIQHVYEKYYRPYVRIEEKIDEAFWRPSEIKRAFGFADMAQYGFSDIVKEVYVTTKKFSADEYVDLLETFPDHRNLPEGDRSALYVGVREAVVQHGGDITVKIVFQLYMGKKP